MTTDSHHELAGPADLARLDEVHDLLGKVWRDAPHVGASERARFTLIVAELVANIIEHGAAGRPEPPHLELTVEVRGGAICGTLTDDGAQPPRSAPGGRRLSRPTPADTPGAPDTPITALEIGALRESGRGLLLVRSVADDLALTHDDGRNRWRFVVRARRTPGAPAS